MTVLQSSQSFVRALKAPTDPPVAGGQLKINLAEQAWKDSSFHVPNKAEVIADWLLSKFFKERGNARTSNPLVEPRYWALLFDVIASKHDSKSPESSPANVWLKPILGRISIAAIVLAFINLLDETIVVDSQELLTHFGNSLSVLWPLGTQKLATEGFLGCWSAYLKNPALLEGATQIGLILTDSYRNSLSNSSGRKKIHTIFLQNQGYLQAWLARVACRPTSPQYEPLLQSIFLAGIETLFNTDTLRQIHDSKDDIPLFQALQSLSHDHRPLVLEILPQLLTQYITSLRKYKGAIFSQGSSHQASGASRTELNAAALQFFASCQTILDAQRRDLQAWAITRDLSNVVGQENLYDSKSEAAMLFIHNVEQSLQALGDCWKEEELETTTVIIGSLSAIIGIDYDLVLPSTLRILTRMLSIPKSLPAHFTLLDLLLEYHIKTRTLSDYLETLFSCLSLQTMPLPLGAQQRYQVCLSSPVLHSLHLEKLSKAIQKFLTPSQCPTTAQHTFELLKNLKEEFKTAERMQESDRGKGSRKKRKSEAIVVDRDGRDPGLVAVAFTLSSRLAQVVLASLPVTSLPRDGRGDLKKSVAEFQTHFIQHTSSKLLKGLCRKGEAEDGEDEGAVNHVKRENAEREGTWGTQIIVAATLSLQYALSMARSLAVPSAYDDKTAKRMLQLLDGDDDDRLPELSLEMFRTLLQQSICMKEPEVEKMFDKVLDYIEDNFQPRSGMAWSGLPHHLTFGRSGKTQSGLALLHMLLERWLPIIDILASSKQLRRLIRITLEIPLDFSNLLGRSSHLLPEHLLLRTLRSAQFWELHHLRTAFLTYLDSSTAELEQQDPSLSSSKESSKQKGDNSAKASRPVVDVSGVIATYRLLLFFPIEYFTKSCRARLVRRAVNADWLLTQWTDDPEEGAQGHPDSKRKPTLSILRIFLNRVFTSIGSVEQQSPSDISGFLLHLVDDPAISLVDEGYADSTLDLAQLYFMELFKQSGKNDTGELSKVLSSFAQYELHDQPRSVRARSLIRMVELLVKEFSIDSFSPEVQTTFKNLHSQLVSSLQEKMVNMLILTTSETLAKAPDLMLGWHALLALGGWVGQRDSLPYFGRQLASKFNQKFVDTVRIKTPEWIDDISVTTLAIMLQEFHCRDAMEQNDQLDLIVATYLTICPRLSPSGRARMDEFIGALCRSLSPSSFGHLLDLVEDSLSKARGLYHLIIDLVHLVNVLLREHPQNTLKILQAFVTRCVNAFNGSAVFFDGPEELRLQVLDFLLQHFSDRPAALRPLDMGGVWTLLSKFLSASARHDQRTSTAIFHKIVAITSAAIRLRRDLVTPMLPHLGMILRQLILSMRSCRPQLGTRQTEMVMNTQPRWINSKHPLGADEAKALSRLLETLTTKTVIRAHMAPAETQKAESLAGSFSKHAAYVLKAYLEAMNDPLCVLSLDIRKELYPGLYALCGMINDHSRDAMMVSALDAGGKTTMKALWKEYEKQRYIGKG